MKEAEMRKGMILLNKQEGEELGRSKEKDKRILKDLQRGKLSIKEIAEDAEVSEEYVLSLRKKNKI